MTLVRRKTRRYHRAASWPCREKAWALLRLRQLLSLPRSRVGTSSSGNTSCGLQRSRPDDRSGKSHPLIHSGRGCQKNEGWDGINVIKRFYSISHIPSGWIITTSRRDLTIIIVSRGNDPQMAARFRLVKYNDLPRFHALTRPYQLCDLGRNCDCGNQAMQLVKSQGQISKTQMKQTNHFGVPVNEVDIFHQMFFGLISQLTGVNSPCWEPNWLVNVDVALKNPLSHKLQKWLRYFALPLSLYLSIYLPAPCSTDIVLSKFSMLRMCPSRLAGLCRCTQGSGRGSLSICFTFYIAKHQQFPAQEPWAKLQEPWTDENIENNRWKLTCIFALSHTVPQSCFTQSCLKNGVGNWVNPGKLFMHVIAIKGRTV